DHPLLIKGLKSMLRYHDQVIIRGTYLNDRELIAGLGMVQPDILLLDIQMQGQSSDKLALLLRKKYPASSIIALSNMEQEYYIKTLLQHGVRGYVLKSSDVAILMEAIRTVYSGANYFDPAIRKVAVKAQKESGNSPIITRREKEVLELIAQDYNSNDI